MRLVGANCQGSGVAASCLLCAQLVYATRQSCLPIMRRLVTGQCLAAGNRDGNVMKTVNRMLISTFVLSTSALCLAQPVTGGGLQQPKPDVATPNAPARVDVQRSAAPGALEAGSDTLKIVLKTLRVTGSQAFAEADLVALTGFMPGQAQTLGELRGLALKIAEHYRQNGYPVAQAFLPAQDINDGAVTITVTEGRYDKILVRNQTNVGGDVIADLMDGIALGDTVRTGPLESHLLLLSDLPGVMVSSTLAPGTAPGTTDLLVDLLPGRRVTGSIDADNAGNRYVGSTNIGATVRLNEPSGQGDMATLRVLTSGDGLNYFRAAYQMHIGKARVGAAYSSLDYRLGRHFQSLLAHGTVKTTSFFGTYPLIRSRHRNLFVGASYDSKQFQDRMDSVGSIVDKSARTLTATLSGDHLDTWGGGGDNGYTLALTSGRVNIVTPGARTVDAATAQTNRRFNKLGFSANRLQRVSDSVALFAGVRGQIAQHNLDISEKMQLGGMYGVRAYPEGEAFGDEGYLLTLEGRYQLPQGSMHLPGQMQLVAFVDMGSVKVNANPWTLEPNHRTLRAIGVGLNWWVSSSFVMHAAYARKLGTEEARSGPDASGRFWLRAVKHF